MKKRVWLGIVLAILCLSGCRDASAPYLLKEEAEQATEETAALIEKETELKEEYCIYVCGAVNRPGVYKLPAGSRIYEAVLLAGGMQEDGSRKPSGRAFRRPDGFRSDDRGSGDAGGGNGGFFGSERSGRQGQFKHGGFYRAFDAARHW